MNAGDKVHVSTDREFEGIVMPSSTGERLVLKLDGGYNVGIDRADATVDVIERDVYDVADRDPDGESAIEFDADLPTIALISTGGTIASTVDYRTGAVTARFDAEDVLRAVPELAGRANYRGRVVANILSENMTPGIWRDLAEAIHEEIAAGADGVVVMHGTDTMAFSAAATAFALDSPVPIVFTGSQRSADRPSSDNVMNAVCAVEAAKGDCAEPLICMHETESDDRCALHRGVRARKNHTSRRDAFDTVGRRPLGTVDYETGNASFRREYRERGAVDLALDPAMNEDVELVQFVPGMSERLLDTALEADGVVIAGTGLGHVHSDRIAALEAATPETVVAMTSQCLEGRVCDRVYDNGRDILEAGVVEVEDTLPETAYVKLMWVLANRDDPGRAMRESLAGECTHRSTPWR
ncbi:Glu-tRNA(Gln) amidotransferase GatDE subunit D [Halobacteriales archaeon SW_7_68_16]|nr:MAG: Glu-tRNA(Gln) amidotransferase GatDE subunit D [Halobacteriales archaeon SW_7_68_16]